MDDITTNQPQDTEPNSPNQESRVTDRAREFASTMATKVGEATQRVGEHMETVGRSVRKTVSPEGAVGTAAASVAETLEGTGEYLQEKSFENMVENLTALVRRYPLQSLLIGMGIGYLLARRTDR